MSPASDARCICGMKWFRSNIKHGSRIALFALAIQFVLSFGHFHGIAAQADAGDRRSPSSNTPASSPDPDQHPGDICAICAVMAMANAVLFATPPLLLLPQAVEFLVPDHRRRVRSSELRSRRLSASRSSDLLISIDCVLEDRPRHARPIRRS